MNCHICGAGIPDLSGWDFCPGCGINLHGKCFSCGSISHAAARFCVKCGKAISHNAFTVKLNGSVSLVIKPLEDDAVIIVPEASGKTVAAHSEISEVPRISKEKDEDEELDSDSFNSSETPDFLKKLGRRETSGEKTIDAGINQQPGNFNGTLNSNSFNISETPDFLKEIIKKGREQKTVFPEVKQGFAAPAGEKAQAPQTKETEKPKAAEIVKKEEPEEQKPLPKAVVQPVEETPKSMDAATKEETSPYQKFKPSPKIDEIIKETDLSPKKWGGMAHKKEAAEADNKISETPGMQGIKTEAEEAKKENIAVSGAPEKESKPVKQSRNYRLIAVDSGNNRIQFISADGKFISSFGTRGSGPGQFDNPQKAVMDQAGNIYVSDFSNNRIQKFSKNGQHILSFGSHGTKNSEFNYPAGMTISKEGLLFVVDSYNNRVQIFDLEGKYVSKFEGSDAGQNTGFDTPSAIAIDSDNHIYVCDTGNNRIIKFDPKWKKVYELGEVDKKNAGFDNPAGIFVDKTNNLIVADTGNNLIKMFDTNGELISCFGSKGQKEGKLDSPGSIIADDDNNIYIADTWNNRVQIFTYDGKLLRAIGSYGSDPGKFNHINDVLLQEEI